ncbi:hypothetical protein BKA80DRAFT_114835 [Phyllosticta citrichinensis]
MRSSLGAKPLSGLLKARPAARMFHQGQTMRIQPTARTMGQMTEARSNIVRLENDDPAAGKALVEFFYRFEYTAGLQEFTDGELIFHTQVYAIGEKYHVQGLKDLAKVHFEEVYEAASSYEELHFGGVVDAVYNTTFASDNGLRSLVVKIVQHDLQNLMANVDYFTEIVTRNGEFSRDLASALFQDREKINWNIKHGDGS